MYYKSLFIKIKEPGADVSSSFKTYFAKKALLSRKINVIK